MIALKSAENDCAYRKKDHKPAEKPEKPEMMKKRSENQVKRLAMPCKTGFKSL
jgi:hypothetical protein